MALAQRPQSGGSKTGPGSRRHATEVRAHGGGPRRGSVRTVEKQREEQGQTQQREQVKQEECRRPGRGVTLSARRRCPPGPLRARCLPCGSTPGGWPWCRRGPPPPPCPPPAGQGRDATGQWRMSRARVAVERRGTKQSDKVCSGAGPGPAHRKVAAQDPLGQGRLQLLRWQ